MSESLNEKFLESVDKVVNLKQKPDDDELLILYGLYKQSIYGTCNIEKPDFYKFTERKKYDAWNSLENMDSEDAKKQYIREVKLLIMKYGLNN
jgi:diazepam-binding inhibitor (GABA receptor modulating acyl-CoA-binding protein)